MASEAPQFDLIRKESGQYTADGVESLWLMVSQEAIDRTSDVRSAKDRLEPKVLVLSAAGATNDLNLKGASIIHSTGGVGFNLSGFIAPSTGKARFVILHNSGAGTVTLKQTATSAAANQLSLLTAADTAIATAKSAGFVYLSAKWRQVF